MSAGIVVGIVRHVRRITYAPKLTLTLCYSATWYAQIVDYVARIVSNRKVKLSGKS